MFYLNPKNRPALLCLLAACAMCSFSCSSSGVKTVDRLPKGAPKGYVEFRIDERIPKSIWRPPLAVFVSKAGEKKPLGFVGSDFAWAPMGYVDRLRVAEEPGTWTYHLSLETLQKLPLYSPGAVGFSSWYETHSGGSVDVAVSENMLTPVQVIVDTNMFSVESGSLESPQ